MELWLNQRFSRPLAASVNYSWQSEPEILDAPNPFLPAELNLPPDPPVQRGGELEWRARHRSLPTRTACAPF